MQITAFNGSPAGRNSASNRIITAFLQGAKRAGAEVACYQLAEYQIRQCQGCFACWFKTPGRCVQADDMPELLQAYQAADVVCLASPVYSWNVTGLLKNFVDRLVPLKSPQVQENASNFDMADAKPRQQKYVAIANCGFPGENNFAIIKAAFSCCNPCLEIYRNCGRLLKTANPAVQPVVEEYLRQVEQAGFELASAGEVSENTLAEMAKPLMSVPEYVKFLGM